TAHDRPRIGARCADGGSAPGAIAGPGRAFRGRRVHALPRGGHLRPTLGLCAVGAPGAVAQGGNAAPALGEVLLDRTGPVHARRGHSGNTLGPDPWERLQRCRRAESLLLRFEDPGEVTEVLL